MTKRDGSDPRPDANPDGYPVAGADMTEDERAALEAAQALDLAWVDDPLITSPPLPVPVMLRAARRFADLSQRELAARVGISKSSLGDLESGDVAAPSYPLVLRLIEATGLKLVVVGPFLMPLTASPFDDAVDCAGRHWPGHLEVREVRDYRDWWFSRLLPGVRPQPAYTADWRRNAGRTRVRRPKSQRNTPPTPPLRLADGDAG